MTTLLIYSCKLVLITGLLYGYYWFFLRNRYFHRYNRHFLLMAAIVGSITPFLAIPMHFSAAANTGTPLHTTLQVISLSNWRIWMRP